MEGRSELVYKIEGRSTAGRGKAAAGPDLRGCCAAEDDRT